MFASLTVPLRPTQIVQTMYSHQRATRWEQVALPFCPHFKHACWTYVRFVCPYGCVERLFAGWFPRNEAMTNRQNDETSRRALSLLAMFSLLNCLIYLDRGAISSNGINADGLEQDFNVSVVRDGLLPSAFMVGLLVSSPVFASLASSPDQNEMRLIAYGLLVWAMSVLGCALSVGFWSLLLCRMAVGVGEASFVALASPFIDDAAPPERKTLWLAVFYACIPVGYALGFLYGGTVAVAVGWRAAFALESLMMLPFIAYAYWMSSQTGGVVRDGAVSGAALMLEFARDALHGRHRTFSLITAALTCYTGVIGSYAFFGPQAAKNMFDVSSETTDIAFSVMTVTTGIFGTFTGGYVLDLMGNSIQNGMKLGLVAMSGAAGMILVAFSSTTSFLSFCVVFSVGQFLLFFVQAPSNAMILWSVPRDQRAIAMSLAVVAQHIAGDVPGPPIMGLIQEHVTHEWRVTMGLAVIVIAVGAACYGIGSRDDEHETRDERLEGVAQEWEREQQPLVGG